MTTKVVKRGSTLPPEVRAAVLAIKDADERNAYIKDLRAKGWTLQSIATVIGTSRERIRQIVEMDTPEWAHRHEHPIPELPVLAEKPKRSFVEPSPSTLARLLELQPYAKQVRSNAKRFRAEAEEYTALLNHAHTVEGVTLYRLALRLGVTHSALRFRLARYGYKPMPENSTSKVYKPIVSANRHK